MQNITSAADLKNAIQTIEAECAVSGQLLKEQFHDTYESFKPVNLFKSAFKDATTSPSVIDNLLVTGVSLAAGYLSKKIITGSSDNKFRKLMGSVLQSEVINLIVQHPEAIKSFGQFIFQQFFRKDETKSDNT